MTIAYVPPWVYAVANGTQTQFTVPFRFFLNSDLEVYANGSPVTAYSVAGAGNPAGGTITFYTPPVANTIVFLRRVTARTQLQDYPANGPFNAAATEAALDKLMAAVQDLLEDLGRRPALPVGIAEALREMTFPAPVGLRLIGYNADGSGLTLYEPTILTVSVDPVSGIAWGKNSATVATSGGATQLVASTLIPAGCKCLGVTYRCTTGFGTSGGLSSVDIGGMGLVDGWGRSIAITAATVTGEGSFTRGDEPRAVNAEDATVTANGGPFDGTGACKLTAHWRTLTPDS